MALPHIPQHAEYQEHLRQSLLHHPGISSSAIQALEDIIHFFCLCDLDPVIRFLSKFYSPLIGRTAFDPTSMFRALLLITQMPVKSFHDIPKFLAANPVYTILCGFDPDKLPAPQTFRDFLDRLASLRKSLKAKRVRKVKTSRAERKKKKSQQGEKSPERPGLVEKLLARLEKGMPIPLVPPVELLNELLAAGFARRSVDAGLLGNPNSLNVAGDGMPFTIHADGSGKKTCSCPHGQPCNHHRRFSSPDADWGRDSSRNAWFYGCHFYELAARGIEEAPLCVFWGKLPTDSDVKCPALYKARRRLTTMPKVSSLFAGTVMENAKGKKLDGDEEVVHAQGQRDSAVSVGSRAWVQADRQELPPVASHG